MKNKLRDIQSTRSAVQNEEVLGMKRNYESQINRLNQEVEALRNRDGDNQRDVENLKKEN